MKHEEFIKKISEIQKTLKANKSQWNAFGKYNYRNCEDILEAVKPLLGDLILTITDELVIIGDRYYVKATAKITDGEWLVETTAYARESAIKKGMDDSQITGSASSYSRKYSLNGLLCICDVKDADSGDNSDQGKKPNKPKTQTSGAKQNQTQQKKTEPTTSTGKVTEKEIKLRVVRMVLYMGNDEAGITISKASKEEILKSMKVLEKLSSYEGPNGFVKGVATIKNVSGKRLMAIYGKVKTAYAEFKYNKEEEAKFLKSQEGEKSGVVQ